MSYVPYRFNMMLATSMAVGDTYVCDTFFRAESIRHSAKRKGVYLSRLKLPNGLHRLTRIK